jgi:hypothetical protein
MKKYCCLLFIFYAYTSMAQTYTNPVFRLQGEVMDEGDSLRSMRDVSVYNKTSKTTYVTNVEGKFNIPVHEGDTIRFHKLGYGRKYYYFKSFVNAENYSIQVLLNSDTIHLKTFVVKSITREKEVHNLFMNSYIRDSLRMITYLRKLQAQQNKTTFQNIVDLSHSPISFIYDTYSKKARNNRKIERARQIIKENQKKDDYAR